MSCSSHAINIAKIRDDRQDEQVTNKRSYIYKYVLRYRPVVNKHKMEQFFECFLSIITFLML